MYGPRGSAYNLPLPPQPLFGPRFFYYAAPRPHFQQYGPVYLTNPIPNIPKAQNRSIDANCFGKGTWDKPHLDLGTQQNAQKRPAPQLEENSPEPKKAKFDAQEMEAVEEQSDPSPVQNDSPPALIQPRPLVKISLTGKETEMQNANGEQLLKRLLEQTSSLETCRAEKTQLERENTELRSKLQVAIEAIRQSSSKSEGQKDAISNLLIEKLKSELAKSLSELQTTQQERDTALGDNRRLYDQLVQMTTEATPGKERENDLQELQKWNETLQSVVARKTETIEKLEKELKKRKDDLLKKDVENAKKIKECHRLKKQLTEGGKAQSELKKAKEEFEKMKDKEEKARKEAEKLLESDKKSVEKRSRKLKHLRKELEILQKKREFDRTKWSDLEKTRNQLAESKRNEEKLWNEMNLMTQSLERKAMRVKTLENELKSTQENCKKQHVSKSVNEMKSELAAPKIKKELSETGIQTEITKEDSESQPLREKLLESENQFFNYLRAKDETLASLREQLAQMQQSRSANSVGQSLKQEPI